MRLEDEIKQIRPFTNEFLKLFVNIAFTSSWLNTVLANGLKSYGLTPQQFNVLKILKGHFPESHNNKAITKRMLDRSSNATRIVDKLISKKLAARVEDKSDRRSVKITITKAGLELIVEIEKEDFYTKDLIRNLDEKKAKQMNAWLDEIRG